MKRAIVIGGGIAGCAVASALAGREWQVDLFEAGASLGTGASGNPAGALHPLLTAAPSALGDFYLAAYRFTLSRLPLLQEYSDQRLFNPCGALWLAADAATETRYRRIADRLGDATNVRMVAPGEGQDITGLEVTAPGLYLPNAAVVDPVSVCSVLICKHKNKINVHFRSPVQQITQVQGQWQIKDADGQPISQAPVLVLCNGWQVTQFPQTAHLPVKPNRGQLTFFPANPQSERLRCIISQSGYLLPAQNGIHVTGASYGRGETDTALRPADHASNLEKLYSFRIRNVPLPKPVAFDAIPGRAAVRATTPGHLPLFGEIPTAPGLYAVTGLGSRGLTTALWCAEQLAVALHA